MLGASHAHNDKLWILKQTLLVSSNLIVHSPEYSARQTQAIRATSDLHGICCNMMLHMVLLSLLKQQSNHGTLTPKAFSSGFMQLLAAGAGATFQHGYKAFGRRVTVAATLCSLSDWLNM